MPEQRTDAGPRGMGTGAEDVLAGPPQDSPAPRQRRTKAEMQAFRECIYQIVEANRPCSVRQVYYLGIPALWNKDRGGKRDSYQDVVRNLGVMRESGMLPWDWITDATRYVRKATMYDSIEEAAQRWAESYRRDLWSTQPRRVEVWAESDSAAGIIDQVTRPLGVGLFSCRGQASKSFAYEAAVQYRAIGKPVTILFVGDWDPTGLAIPRSLEQRLQRYSNNEVPIDFVRVAVTEGDVAHGRFESHDVNGSDKNYRRFVEHCRFVCLDEQTAVELEAIPPAQLRDRVHDAILNVVDDVESWNATIAAEESELEIIARMLGTVPS